MFEVGTAESEDIDAETIDQRMTEWKDQMTLLKGGEFGVKRPNGVEYSNDELKTLGGLQLLLLEVHVSSLSDHFIGYGLGYLEGVASMPTHLVQFNRPYHAGKSGNIGWLFDNRFHMNAPQFMYYRERIIGNGHSDNF